MLEPERSSLESLSDADGSIVIGWLAARVLYARLEGALSTKLGEAYAARLLAHAVARPKFHFFADAHRLTQYDLLARSAFMRVVLANRPRFEKFTFLTWQEGISPVARSLSAVLGDGVELLTNEHQFELRLTQAAPGCRSLLGKSA